MVGIEGTTGVWRGDELRIEDERARWTWIDTPVESVAKNKDSWWKMSCGYTRLVIYPFTRPLCYKHPPYTHATSSILMYTPAIIHLAHIHHLLAARPRNLVRQLLVCQRFPRRLHHVHLIARARCLGSEVLQASGARELEDEMLGAESKACCQISSGTPEGNQGDGTNLADEHTTAPL
jgi:hypothetical protein